jgi:opacity protein-like surface antigen
MAGGWLVLVAFLLVNTCRADTVTLHLRNGASVTGEMISLDTTFITITNSVLGKIAIPVVEIQRLEKKNTGQAAGQTNAPPQPATATNQPPAKPMAQTAPTNQPPARAALPAPAPQPAATAAAQPAANKPPAAQPPPVKPKPPKRWTIDAQVGADLQYNQNERRLYYGRAKWTYGKERFRSIVDYLATYGKTDGILSANDMNGSVRVELDVEKTKRVFLFNAAGAGYNEIRKIDLGYDDSFGLGYKLVARTNLTLNTDFGVNYQRQHFSNGTSKDYGALRLGELMGWKISSKWILDEKFEFYPRFTDIGHYRMRFETNLRYLLSNSLNLNLTVIDQYDTQPASSVTRNDLLVRATLGFKF